MSYLKNNLKKRLTKYAESKPAPVFIFGSAQDNNLTTKCFAVHSLSKRINNQIETLKKTAQILGLPSLSANQIYQFDSIFIINKHVESNKQWSFKSKDLSDYNVYINPVITHIKKEVEKDYELCASYPFLKVWAWRFKEIKVNYFNFEFEETSEILKDFPARVFQHESDHVHGTDILDWRVCHGELEIKENALKDYPNFDKALRKYKKAVDDIKKNFPNILNFYKDEKNFEEFEEENGEKWYKYHREYFRDNLEVWSKEQEIMKALQQSSEIDFNITMVNYF